MRLRRMHADEHTLGRNDYRDWEAKIKDFLERCNDQQKWTRPHYNKDRLVDSPDGTGPYHEAPTRSQTTKDRRNQISKSISRADRAANVVQGDPVRRNALRDGHGIKAIEMESSGVADAGWVAGVGYLVVRGTCDYCNAAKADGWHDYAALIAACYAKTVVEYMHPESPSTAMNVLDYSQQLNAETFGKDTARMHDGDFDTFHCFTTKPAGSERVERRLDRRESDIDTVRFDCSLFGPDQTVKSCDESEPTAPELTCASTKDAMADLVSMIDELQKELRWEETVPLAEDLEKRLKCCPRKGVLFGKVG